MLERRIDHVGGGYVVYTEDGRRLDAYLTAKSAERAAIKALTTLGGGRVVRVDGSTLDVDPSAALATR